MKGAVEFPHALPLAAAEARAEDVIFQAVCIFRREGAEQIRLEERKEEILRPALPRAFFARGEEAEQAVREDDEGVILHGTPLVDESGNAVR